MRLCLVPFLLYTPSRKLPSSLSFFVCLPQAFLHTRNVHLQYFHLPTHGHTRWHLAIKVGPRVRSAFNALLYRQPSLIICHHSTPTHKQLCRQQVVLFVEDDRKQTCCSTSEWCLRLGSGSAQSAQTSVDKCAPERTGSCVADANADNITRPATAFGAGATGFLALWTARIGLHEHRCIF